MSLDKFPATNVEMLLDNRSRDVHVVFEAGTLNSSNWITLHFLLTYFITFF